MSLYVIWSLVGLVWVGTAFGVGLTIGRGISNADKETHIPPYVGDTWDDDEAFGPPG